MRNMNIVALVEIKEEGRATTTVVKGTVVVVVAVAHSNAEIVTVLIMVTCSVQPDFVKPAGVVAMMVGAGSVPTIDYRMDPLLLSPETKLIMMQTHPNPLMRLIMDKSKKILVL